MPAPPNHPGEHIDIESSSSSKKELNVGYERDYDEADGGMSVPYTELSGDALRGVIESFVLREGTDYGHREMSLESKIADVVRQLERGEAQVVFDPGTASVDVVVVDSAKR